MLHVRQVNLQEITWIIDNVHRSDLIRMYNRNRSGNFQISRRSVCAHICFANTSTVFPKWIPLINNRDMCIVHLNLQTVEGTRERMGRWKDNVIWGLTVLFEETRAGVLVRFFLYRRAHNMGEFGFPFQIHNKLHEI